MTRPLTSCLVALALFASAARAATVEVKPDDARILYVGRFDTRDPAGPRCAWPASEVRLRVNAASVAVRVKSSKPMSYAVAVDDGPATTVAVEAGERTIPLLAAAGASPGEHVVSLVRRNEATVGVTQILGVALDGTLLEPMRPTRKLEIIGDSISCGYGNESSAVKDKHSWAQENAYLSYGGIAARALDADYHCVAWSGRKMWPDRTIASVYDLALPEDAGSAWDFNAWRADVVVINLSTNDFSGPDVPDEGPWTQAYEAFVRRVEQHYPDAIVYVATSPMLSDAWPKDGRRRSLSVRALTRVVDELRAAGDAHVRLLTIDQQNGNVDGMGSGAHPTLRTHVKMARRLAETLHADLGWPLVPIPDAPPATQPTTRP